ncbi:uncharacterized protein TNCV_174461 [Trichonephila clavipes]|nr:uncharacterized protein TNCV_174461 [Trichonephila clavipes]
MESLGKESFSQCESYCVMFEVFVTNEKDFSAVVDAKEEDIAEEMEVETCECKHFQSNPRDIAGRPKLNIVGFHDSMFEKRGKCGKRG